jgi:hypothetical protein
VRREGAADLEILVRSEGGVFERPNSLWMMAGTSSRLLLLWLLCPSDAIVNDYDSVS